MRVSKKSLKEAVFTYKVLCELGGMALTTQIRSALNALGRLDYSYKRALKLLIKMGRVKTDKVKLGGVYYMRWEVTKTIGTIQ